MSEYNMSHTGAELDDAINKFKSGYIDKTKVTHFATGIVPNVTAGMQMSVTGIKDEKTGETFTPKGIIGFICPTSTDNFYSSGNKPAVVAFYRNDELGDCAAIAAYNTAYSIRIHTETLKDGYNGEGKYTELEISGNSFTYYPLTAGMYGLMAAARWRWVAWG